MFGDILFADGLFGDTGGIVPTGRFWSEQCLATSLWDDKNAQTTSWVNQPQASTNWSTEPRSEVDTLECG